MTYKERISKELSRQRKAAGFTYLGGGRGLGTSPVGRFARQWL